MYTGEDTSMISFKENLFTETELLNIKHKVMNRQHIQHLQKI